MSNTSLLFRGKPDTRTGDLISIDLGISDISEIMYKLNWKLLKERELVEDEREKRPQKGRTVTAFPGAHLAGWSSVPEPLQDGESLLQDGHHLRQDHVGVGLD